MRRDRLGIKGSERAWMRRGEDDINPAYDGKRRHVIAAWVTTHVEQMVIRVRQVWRRRKAHIAWIPLIGLWVERC